MQIQLCKKSLDRSGSQSLLLHALRERDHSPVVKDCLNRCQPCDLGLLIAAADGSPLTAPTVDELLAAVDALAAEEE